MFSLNRVLSEVFFAVLMITLFPILVNASETAFILKSGTALILDDHQVFDYGFTRNIDETSSPEDTLSFNTELRVMEGEFGFGLEYLQYKHNYFANYPSDATTRSLFFTSRAYIRHKPGNLFRPFVGGGVGVSEVKNNVNLDTHTEWYLTYQLMGGFEYRFTKNVGLFAEIKGVFLTDDFSSEDDPIDLDTSSVNFLIGYSVFFEDLFD